MSSEQTGHPAVFTPNLTRELFIPLDPRKWIWIPGLVLGFLGIEIELEPSFTGLFWLTVFIYTAASVLIVGQSIRRISSNGVVLTLERRSSGWSNQEDDEDEGGLFPDVIIPIGELQMYRRAGLLFLGCQGSKQYFIASGKDGARVYHWVSDLKIHPSTRTQSTGDSSHDA